MNALQLVKILFDDRGMSDEIADLILFGCTGWPCFFKGDPIRCLCYQLRHAKRSLNRGFTVDQIYTGSDRIKRHRIA